MKTIKAESFEKTRAGFEARSKIVGHFLEIFRHQIGEKQEAPAKFEQMDPHGKGPEHVYELSVKRGDKWSTRRMTVSSLAEDSGSKGSCYKVIYDNLLVIKIPPIPIKSYRKYVESIKAEGRVSTELSPEIPFVSPMVSALLKSIHTFPDSASVSPSDLEGRYLIWLDVNPEFRKYLKINGEYVFFMDLSTHIFMSNVIDQMHDREKFRETIREAITQSSYKICESRQYDDEYQNEDSMIYLRVQTVFSDFKTRINTLLERYKAGTVTEFNLQKWFLLRLAEDPISENGNDFPKDFIPAVNTMLDKIMLENAGSVAAFRKTTEACEREKAFIQNRPRMSGIVTNILDLVAWLWEKNLSIRDLKPDNIFVAGDQEKYPIFLSAPDEFSLGLIDFETSVRMDKKHSERIPQPLLGGTPYYATPSHIFQNDMLRKIFKDLPRILHIQDWHAAVGLIYKVATGEDLFSRTAGTIKKIMNMRREFIANKIPLEEVFYYGSRMFWNSALGEFREKTRRHEIVLKSVPVAVPKNALVPLLAEVKKAKNSLAKAIKRYVLLQSVFINEKSRKYLLRSSCKEIGDYRKLWEKKMKKPGAPTENIDQAVRILANLEELKLRYQHQERVRRILEQDAPKISCSELIEIMFNTVLSTMYKEEWGKLSVNEKKPAESADGSEGRTVLAGATAEEESTVIYENTIGLG